MKHVTCNKEQRGITLLLTVFVLGGVLAISAALSATAIIQLRISGAVEDSTMGFYGADAGIECRLYYIRQGGPTTDSCDTGTLENPAISYSVSQSGTTMKGIGLYRTARRGIEATY